MSDTICDITEGSEPIMGFFGDYRWLSNMVSCEVDLFGNKFKSSEHAYQAMKSTNDIDFVKIKNAKTSRLSKTIANSLPIRSDWDDVKDDYMFITLFSKFTQYPFSNRLRDTGDRMIVESNTWHDNYWGDCTCDDCKNIIGLNKLGRQLMRIRKLIAEPKER